MNANAPNDRGATPSEPSLDADSPDDLELERLARDLRRARGFGVAARRALYLARRYRFEEGPRGAREIACVVQAMAWRAAAKELRTRRSTTSTGVRPGLARASVPPPAPARTRETG